MNPQDELQSRVATLIGSLILKDIQSGITAERLMADLHEARAAAQPEPQPSES